MPEIRGVGGNTLISGTSRLAKGDLKGHFGDDSNSLYPGPPSLALITKHFFSNLCQNLCHSVYRVVEPNLNAEGRYLLYS
jgi:hypothetical protein